MELTEGAAALGQVRDKKESGEIPAGDPPIAEAPDAPPAAKETTAAEAPPAAEAPTAVEEPPAAEAEAQATVDPAPESQAEPAKEPAQEDDSQADASAETEPGTAEANPTKED